MFSDESLSSKQMRFSHRAAEKIKLIGSTSNNAAHSKGGVDEVPTSSMHLFVSSMRNYVKFIVTDSATLLPKYVTNTGICH